MFVSSTQSSGYKVFGEIVEGVAELLEALEGFALVLVVEPFDGRYEVFEEF